MLAGDAAIIFLLVDFIFFFASRIRFLSACSRANSSSFYLAITTNSASLIAFSLSL
jgi:hypothetical protein